jgi:hypothetical protein
MATFVNTERPSELIGQTRYENAKPVGRAITLQTQPDMTRLNASSDAENLNAGAEKGAAERAAGHDRRLAGSARHDRPKGARLRG